ncbi:hypothetical protein F5144DRAFT_44407 [Chaetomium tenue]|uniref:Uncharacterized protein n=1 Tax=Chaetomium tenue TaxID=1854479 RepID=A0ACB7PMV1_9PEZI|nr:hypothetical protein F5144DRAFT_44407 [Chaetomium globosum]
MASEEDIESFVGITGANRTAAERVLELCGSELEQAIQLWFTDEDLQRSLSNVGSSAAAATTAPASRPSRPNRAQIGREDAQGVIHIDSDDDDVPMTEDEADDGEEVASVARRAQEEEDAAMAKRLQDELFSGPAGADEASDAVRAPMARTTETLIGPSFGGEDDDDDAHAAVLEQLRRRQQARARPTNNPFAQSVWEDNSGAPGSASSGSGRASHLANLFRPPYDLMSQMSWDEARDEGKDSKKWILVNLQDTSIFSCQALNRDIWKDEAITSLVRENFIFLQYDKNNMAAEQYLTFYFPNESHQNPDNYPHVSIIDPRTGEQVKVFSGSPFPNALEFHAQLAEFLDRYSLSENSKNPVSKAKRPERVVDVDRMTEDEMLEMALQNSLNANGGTKQPNIQDPDELTKSIGALAENGQSSAGSAELATGEPAASTPQESAFARIPSDRPHVEPLADPKTTTRLQVRNPPGRIIRRFRLDEPVSRIYEWLKAEPLPGKEGVEFELKSMPPNSADLIEHLDETIQEAGLANAVVMLEFI